MQEIDVKYEVAPEFFKNFWFSKFRIVTRCDIAHLVGGVFMAFKEESNDGWEEATSRYHLGQVNYLAKVIAKRRTIWMAFKIPAIPLLESMFLDASDMSSFPDPNGALERLLLVPSYLNKAKASVPSMQIPKVEFNPAQLAQELQKKEEEHHLRLTFSEKRTDTNDSGANHV